MNWDIKEIHNYNEYMQKYSIHSLLAKIFAQREYNEQDVQGHTSKRLIYHCLLYTSRQEEHNIWRWMLLKKPILIV